MEPYNASTSCRAVSSRDDIHTMKEIVFPFKPEIAARTESHVALPTMALVLNIPARIVEELEARRDAAEADEILRTASPEDFVPWEEAKKRLEL